MTSFSTFLRNAVVNAIVNATSFSVAQIHVSLHTANPGDTGANEVSGGSYARQTASFGAAASGSAETDADVDFLDMPAATVTHVGLWDAVTGGNFLGYATLASSKTVGAGDSLSIAAGSLDVDLNR